ncbi:MAG TPA: alpha-2-macroglobulin family protein [Blastocatellia bacterium]|nr:alpha-2-macroglobulin family protein [Blastocatellia bacterium]
MKFSLPLSYRLLVAFALLSLVCFTAPLAQQFSPTEYERLKAEAEKLYAESSYSKAHELYQKADKRGLSPREARWVDFRLADTQWRAQAATETSDDTKYEQARQQLEALVRDAKSDEDRDRVWAEVHQSLGDFWWTRRNSRNWGAAWPHYQQALDWWAGTRDVELARQRYLTIVWTIAQPQGVEQYYYYGYYGNYVPLEILGNVLKIAKSENDKARAHYLIAMTIRNQYGDWEQRQRVPEEFEAAIKAGNTTDWYDDALYHYGEWMVSNGRIVAQSDGGWRQEQDYVKALELFRRLVSEFSKGETRYYDQAQAQIESIIKPAVSVNASNIFLPDSEIQFYAGWRNVKRVDFALYKTDLTSDVRFSRRNESTGEWLQRISLAGRERVKSWSKETGDKGDYKPGQENIRLDGKLPVGAYVLEAKAAGQTARDLILVTDATVVLKTAGKQALVYFCNAVDGSPIAGARVKAWERGNNDNDLWRELVKETNQEGIAVFDLREKDSYHQLFISAIINDRQSFSLGYSNDYQRPDERWRIYAFTDRPAYRPKETVQWKFVARQYANQTYVTPANQTVEFEIHDPKGSKVKEGKSALNAFGSAWGQLEITESMPLGPYQITFYDAGRRNQIGSAQLFRVEEYKLPEFKVSVQTPEENGKKKAFKLGEKVEVQVQADYYFGGAVSDASVELVVYQNPFYQWWQPARDYPWLYEDDQQRRYYYGGGRGQIIKRETVKTDATGKAVLSFETPRNSGQDFEYNIEARVTDASRREIIGSGNVRVTRQRYYVYPRAQHNLYRPQDKVTADIKALDANDQPVEAEGTVKVTRDYWYEIWLDPSGREVKGDELRRLREQAARTGRPFPPSSQWRIKFVGYQHDDILTQPAKTNAEGTAEFSFTPDRAGWYRIAWTSLDKSGAPIRGETAVWVTTNATTELGYRHGGLEIIVDKDTFRAGQKAPVMLHTPTSNRWVLFSVEGDNLYSYQLVHLDGTVKLLEVPIEERHEPNIFLSAAMVSDRQLFADTKQVIVPPDRHFLSVDVKPDREQYQAREDGTLTVTTRDRDGKPVAAEVSLGLVDESVFYIQQDYAGDPRQFYYGGKRPQIVQTQSTFQQKQYAKLVEGENKQLMDDRQREALEKDKVGYRRDAESYDELRAKKENNKAPYSVSENIVYISGAALSRKADAEDRFEAKQIAELPINGRNYSQLAQLAPGVAGGEFGANAVTPGREPAVQVRNDFRSTVFWQPDVATGKDGKAVVKVKYPDSLTSWKATARAATAGNQFGIASAGTRTKQPLIVRLQAPRFFVVGDTVTVSAVINNNTDKAMTVAPSLNAEGLVAKGDQAPVEVAANSEKRVNWLVSVEQPGNAKLKVTARGEKYADAMEKSFIVHEHGIEKFLAKSGKMRGDEVTVRLDIPKERKPGTTTLTVQVAPSMAVTMLDALPYLIDYPYGCTEQTMSRFLPAAIVAKTLRDLKLEPEIAMRRIFGGIEPESADKTHPKGMNDLRELDEMVRQGLERLYNFQHSDGGWGWWKEGESDHFMTAYVVWGLTLARDAGIEVKAGVIQNGAAFLDKELVEEEVNYDQQAWMLHALAAYHASAERGEVSAFQRKAFDNLWGNRDKLNAYTRALLALAAHQYGFGEQAKTLVRNLENGVKRDTAPDTSVVIRGEQKSDASVMGTAHWGEDGIYWRWSDGGVEATSFALRALLAIDPQNKLIEPVTNWLIKNRRGSQWSNTRDTAITILTLNDYLRVSGELKPELEYELVVNGQRVAAKKLSAADALTAPSQFAINRELIRDGANEIRIARKGGTSPVYFSAQAQFFSREEPLKAAGNEIFVRRDYYKLVGRQTLLKGWVYDKVPLRDGETVASGDRVEAVITIEAKNNYEYLLFEDLKPAGLEAVQIRSGQSLFARERKSGALESGDVATAFTGRTRWVYQELRDRKVAMFIDHLPEGVWEIRYDLRAETPGAFHALPVLGHAMYVPEIRCNSVEERINVAEGK